MAPVQPPLILLQFWAQKSQPPLRKRAFLHTENVEPPGVEPGSKQATPAAFSMLSPRLIFDQRLTVDGPSLT